MKNIAVVLLLMIACTEGHTQSKEVKLPNGWTLTPAGKSLPLGDLPLNIAVSPDKKLIAITNNGQSTQSIQLIDAVNDKVLQSVEIPKSWLGLKFSADQQNLYASGGNDNWILQYAISNRQLVLKDSIKLGAKWPVKISPAGIEINDAAKIMYVVTKENNSLYVIDLKTKTVISQYPLGAEAFTCALSPDKKELYISLWGADKIMVYNTGAKNFTDSIAVGDNPNDICLSKNGRYRRK